MALFSAEDRAWMRAPHVSRNWFGYFDLPSGERWLHNGVGRIVVDGQEYRGVSDPAVGQMASVSAVENPRFGQAAKVDVVIGGISAQSFREWRAFSSDLEGRRAILRFGIFDPETLSAWLFKPLFPGQMSAPKLYRGPGVENRFVGLTIEGFFHSQNYPFGGRWNGAGQKARYSGDKGLDFCGVTVNESWQ